jgi:membrane fusion protein (multidrug efflux system)
MIAASEPWQRETKAVGSIRAYRGVDVANEVPGVVEAIFFESGKTMKAGTPLISLRAEDDVARLKALEAAERLASITYHRNRKLLKSGAVAQATVDVDLANLTSARAQVAQQKAMIAKKSIRAPFTGEIGIRRVDVGQYLNPGTPIATLQQLDPIYLDFYLPQQELAQVKVGQRVKVTNDSYADKVFEGKIAAINSRVEESTRNVLVRASLKNAERLLLPGMFANALVEVGEAQPFITLPQTAITYNPYGNTVFVVDRSGKDDKGAETLVAKQVFVTVGDTRGDQVAVLTGIAEGDEVVTSGQLKIQNGFPLVINNSITPSNDPAPKPQDPQ